MKITVPIYVQKQPQRDAAPQLHILRPLFHPHIEERGEDLNRAVTKLAQTLRRECDRQGQNMRHEMLSRFSFAPDAEDHFLKLAIDLRDRRVECHVLVVTFRALNRKVAFAPAVPDVWFEVERGETLANRATEALTQYFRQKEKRDGVVALSPEAVSVDGKAWMTTLDISVSPPSFAKPPKENLFALLGGGADELNGADELEEVGRCLDYLYPDDLNRVVLRDEEVTQLTRLLDGTDRRPVLLIGPRLAGKTALVHEYVYRAVERRGSKFSSNQKTWLLAPQRLISGMSYVGQWENRLTAILKEAKKRRHLLYFDDLLGLYRAGQTSNSTLSVADVLKPFAEKREVRLLGEITPEAFRVLQERDCGFADLFHLLPVKEADEDTTLRILLHLMRQLERKHRCAFATDAFPALMDVERRYVRDAAFPGKAALFLEQLAVKFRNERITRDEVLNEFHAKSGLSLTFLNEQAKLTRREVGDAVSREVIGQAAAVEACADVVAMAKARLNDTERPLASFLFLGPTGVGKTQCAKSLAAYLFGDAEKIIRFDMNEYSSPYAAARLVGTFDQPEGLLTSAVRRQPFAVLLLDEIEKAHPDVFNLLLQVMGDGRLTDALGRTVDFTNAIIILTSNLGVKESAKNLGFRQDGAGESRAFTQAAEKFFKPEFFNRLDRVVPFERLTREDVKKIAEGLIQNVFARDGLVRRRSVLQVDERAMERIVDEGYHPQLGARALKRMLERRLTQPVAARLAPLKPDAPALIQVYLAGAAVAVTVDPLAGAAANEAAMTLIELVEPARLIELVEAVVGRVEAQVAESRPEGLINPSEVGAEHLAYFYIKEQTARVRELCRRLEAGVRGAKREQVARSRGRSISARQFTLRQVIEGDLWQRVIRSDDLRGLLKELAASAQAYGEHVTGYLAELLREASLLNILAQTGDGETTNRAVLLISSLDESRKQERGTLAESYAAMFEHKLGMNAKILREGKELTALNAAALMIQGVNALSVARGEEGAHLIHTAQDRLVPIQVSVLTPEDDDVSVAIQRYAERRQSWLDELSDGKAADEKRFALPPVVRIYDENGAALDLRSGLMTLKPPTATELRAFVLAALPLPAELAEIGGEVSNSGKE